MDEKEMKARIQINICQKNGDLAFTKLNVTTNLLQLHKRNFLIFSKYFVLNICNSYTHAKAITLTEKKNVPTNYSWSNFKFLLRVFRKTAIR